MAEPEVTSSDYVCWMSERGNHRSTSSKMKAAQAHKADKGRAEWQREIGIQTGGK